MAKNVAVVLSGCGFLDGAEVREAVLSLLHLDAAGAQVRCLAPDIDQHHVVDHRRGEPASGECRNVLTESARIARGKIENIASVAAQEFDAVVLPGGFGVAKNLCDFAMRGAEAEVHPDVSRLLREAHDQGKPIGAVCIAPALVAAVFGRELQPMLTIGEDPDTAAALETMGATHKFAPVDQAVVDEANKIATCPAYMYGDAGVHPVSEGIRKMVDAVLAMA